MNLQLLYLHVHSQVAVALGNVHLAHTDVIKERKQSERLVAEGRREMKEQHYSFLLFSQYHKSAKKNRLGRMIF